MSVKRALAARLAGNTGVTGIVGTSPFKIFPGLRPQGANGAAPCIVVRIVSGREVGSFAGSSKLRENRVEVRCYGSTQDEADNLLAAVAKPVGDGGPLNGFKGTVPLGGGAPSVVVQHCLADDERDDADDPKPGAGAAQPYATMDFMVMWERP